MKKSAECLGGNSGGGEALQYRVPVVRCSKSLSVSCVNCVVAHLVKMNLILLSHMS